MIVQTGSMVYMVQTFKWVGGWDSWRDQIVQGSKCFKGSNGSMGWMSQGLKWAQYIKWFKGTAVAMVQLVSMFFKLYRQCLSIFWTHMLNLNVFFTYQD